MITKKQALHHQDFHHVRVKNADGTPARCRANGACKVWKTRPDDFRLPVVHGLRDYFYIDNDNAGDWITSEE